MKRLLLQLSIVLVLPLVFSGLAGAQDTSSVAISVNGKYQSTDTRGQAYTTITEVAPGLTPEQEAALITEATAPITPDDEIEAVGQITDEAAVTDREALPEETETEDENNEVLGTGDETAGLIQNIALVVVVLALGYYVFFNRRDDPTV